MRRWDAPALQPLLVVALLLGVSALAAPIVKQTGERVEAYDIQRDLPLELWKWTPPMSDGGLTGSSCDRERIQMDSAVTHWPKRVLKQVAYEMAGRVWEEDARSQGVPQVKVDVYLNETKSEPGIHLGAATTDATGAFTLSGNFPDDLPASRYHLVLHAHERERDCKTYLEHWSDPEMEVLAQTRISVAVPKQSVVGEETTVRGWLEDIAGLPVPNATIRLEAQEKRYKVETDAEGKFAIPVVPREEGAMRVNATFEGTRYHGGATVETNMTASSHTVLLPDVAEPLTLVRGERVELPGRVVGVPIDEVEATFEGIHVRACPDCDPVGTLTLDPDRDGDFTLDITVPSEEALGNFTLTLGAVGAPPVSYDGVLMGATTLDAVVTRTETLGRDFRVVFVARDDTGQPVAGTVRLQLPNGTQELTLDAGGYAPYAGTLSCGAHELPASLEPPQTHRPAQRTTSIAVCPWASGWPDGLVDRLWMLPFVPVLAALAWWAYRRYQVAFASELSWGPPLAIELVEPGDDAAGIVGVGERARVRVRAPEGIPAGHRVRAGRPGALDAAGGADATCELVHVAHEPGVVRLRAEIVDAKGRPRTRRTMKLRFVRYPEEIERRFLELRRHEFGPRAPAVSPRDLAQRLVAAAPDASPDVDRLASLFEEADYSLHAIEREALVAYLRAEREVTAPRDPQQPGSVDDEQPAGHGSGREAGA